MDIIEKLRIMLPHWIEHNRSHQEEFAEWAKQLEEMDAGLADQLSKAVSSLKEVQGALEKALALTGGPLSEEHGHGHQHLHH
ncbi:MAG TPA: hypothetical protein ENK96_04145 [Desulfobulbaceae bacterium]|nr:hypothetical protein [Desulfobulbaceae bacterium]